MRFSPKADAHATQMLARCIHELESRTTAEIVLVLRRSSGNYRDVDHLFGAFLTFLLLCIILYSPWEFEPLATLLPLILTFFLGSRLSVTLGRWGPRRFWTREQRRLKQVKQSASIAFFDKKVQQTHSHTGILLYFSVLEKRAELLADHSALAALSPKLEALRENLTTACSDPKTIQGSVEGLAAYLRTLGVYLGQVLPWDPALGEKSNELDDSPELGEESE